MYPILQFDPDPKAILNPSLNHMREKLPPHVVLCFFQEIIRTQVEEGRLREIGFMASEIGVNPIYLYEQGSKPVAVVHPGVCASLAAGFLEELISGGGKRFVACGGCGVLNRDIATGHILLVESAIRDEGTSYHYLPPAPEVRSTPYALATLEGYLERKKVDYLRVKTWTTDGIYRETAAKRDQRKAEGCLAVEMEAAAFFAVAHFRGVEFGQFIYAGDLVVPEGWDRRDWHDRSEDRRFLYELALEACQEMDA